MLFFISVQVVDVNPKVGKVKNDDAKKRLSVERIYQKKTQLEHILLRPDTYIGSVEQVTQVSELMLGQLKWRLNVLF